MSKTVKKSSLVELEDRRRSLRDLENHFVRLGLNLPDVMPNKDLLDNHHSKENLPNVAQSKTTSPNSCNCDHCKDETLDTDYLERLLLEELYWNQFGNVKDKLNTKPKYPTLQRTKQRESDFTTFRQTNSKEQEERKLSSQYKLDKTTTLALERLLDIRSLGQYHKIIGKGTNSIVIHAGNTVYQMYSGAKFLYPNAVKIYKLQNDDAINKAIFRRTQREYNRLNCMSDGPVVVCYWQNVIVMRLIGSDLETAPSISCLPQELSEETYYMIIKKLKSWYNDMDIVHGKLSTRNILYVDNKPFYIGWSHSVNTNHSCALKKLMKDCHFVTKFFRQRKVKVETAEQLFKSITKIDKLCKEVVDLIYGRSPATPRHK